jgi:hypothetical protein
VGVEGKRGGGALGRELNELGGTRGDRRNWEAFLAILGNLDEFSGNLLQFYNRRLLSWGKFI